MLLFIYVIFHKITQNLFYLRIQHLAQTIDTFQHLKFQHSTITKMTKYRITCRLFRIISVQPSSDLLFPMMIKVTRFPDSRSERAWKDAATKRIRNEEEYSGRKIPKAKRRRRWACNCRNPNRIGAYGCSPTPHARVIWAFGARQKRGSSLLAMRDERGKGRREAPGEFPGIAWTRAPSGRMEPYGFAGQRPWWYRSNDINVASRTGYINIMLTRFSVKRAPPAETVASAGRGPDTQPLQPPANTSSERRSDLWEINRDPRRYRFTPDVSLMNGCEGMIKAWEDF